MHLNEDWQKARNLHSEGKNTKKVSEKRVSQEVSSSGTLSKVENKRELKRT